MKLRLFALALLLAMSTSLMKADSVTVSYSSDAFSFIPQLTWLDAPGSINVPIGGTSPLFLLGTWEYSGVDPLALVGPGGTLHTGDGGLSGDVSVSVNGESASATSGIVGGHAAMAIDCTGLDCSVNLSGPFFVDVGYSVPDQLLAVNLFSTYGLGTHDFFGLNFDQNPGSLPVYAEVQVTKLSPPKASEPSSAFLAIGPAVFYLIRRRHLRPDRAS